jgi:hypothetical protein
LFLRRSTSFTILVNAFSEVGWHLAVST